MTFDLSTHVFGTIALPEPSREITQPTIIQGCLALISMEGSYTRIWVRREGSWSVFSESRGLRVEGIILNVSQPSRYEWFQVYNRKLGYVQSRLVDFNAASCMVQMEMCSETLQLLSI